MKKTLFFLLTVLIIAGGCSKKSNSSNTIAPDVMTYAIDGITDLSLPQSADTFLALGIKHVGGHQEKLTLSVKDIPEGLSANFETPSGIPGFGTKMIIKSNNATPGTYKVKVVATTESNQTKEFSFAITIWGPPDHGCTEDIIGNYTADFSGDTTGTISTIISKTGIKNEASIYLLLGYDGPGIFIKLDCSGKSISIQQQTRYQWAIEGSGSFANPQKINLTYKITTGTQTRNYQAILTRKP